MTNARDNGSSCGDRREALLEAASHLFAAKGYAAVGTREIAERAGVNLALIQYYFGSKGKLFIEVVHRMFEGGAGVAARAELEGTPSEPGAATEAVCRFVRVFLGHLLQATHPQGCRIMYRELLGDRESEPEIFEALMASVTDSFVRPLQSSLAGVLRAVAPRATEAELNHAVWSIVGQCSMYLTHRPLLERLRGESLAGQDQTNALARHVARFSLRGLGCDEGRIEQALSAVFPMNRNAGEPSKLQGPLMAAQ